MKKTMTLRQAMMFYEVACRNRNDIIKFATPTTYQETIKKTAEADIWDRIVANIRGTKVTTNGIDELFNELEKLRKDGDV